MMCVLPVTIRNPKQVMTAEDFKFIKVPCGKCPECVKRKASNWFFRLSQELKVSTSAVFLTLTYSDEHLPRSFNGFPTLEKKDFQKFLKKLRRRLDALDVDHKIRYFACGEYGARFHRPHYHAIMFNLPKPMSERSELIEVIWSKGRTQIDPVNDGSIKYVVGYVHKPFVPLEGHEDIDDREPHFQLMSKGLGKNFLTDAQVKYQKSKLNPYLVVQDGQKMAMPRYYKDKIFSDKEKEILSRKAREHLRDFVLTPEWTEHVIDSNRRKYATKRTKQ